jgi:hypothetical protein
VHRRQQELVARSGLQVLAEFLGGRRDLPDVAGETPAEISVGHIYLSS